MFPAVSAAPGTNGTNGTKASVPASTRNISDNSAEKPRQQPKTTKRNIRPSLRTAGYAQRCRKALFVPEKSRDERRFEQVIGAFADAAHDVVVARTFDLDDDVLHAGFPRVGEDGVEAHHAALADLTTVLDVQEPETPRILLEVVHRAGLAHHGPVDVHFEQHLVGIGVFEHVVQHDLILDLLELARVVVVAELHAGGRTARTHLVEIAAVGLQILERRNLTHRGDHDIFRTGGLVRRDALVPPSEGLRKIAARQLLVGEVERAVRGNHPHTGILDILAELLGSLPVEHSVLVAGGLDRSVAHVGELFQDGFVIALALAENPDQAAHRIELDTDVLLRGFLRFGGCSAGEHRQSEEDADDCE